MLTHGAQPTTYGAVTTTGRLQEVGVAGFSVDLGALEQATQGIDATLTQVGDGKVSDYDGSKSDFGNDDLAGTLSDFCDRWQIGVQKLRSATPRQPSHRTVHLLTSRTSWCRERSGVDRRAPR
jgi:hypothetical protein